MVTIRLCRLLTEQGTCLKNESESKSSCAMLAKCVPCLVCICGLTVALSGHDCLPPTDLSYSYCTCVPVGNDTLARSFPKIQLLCLFTRAPIHFSLKRHSSHGNRVSGEVS